MTLEQLNQKIYALEDGEKIEALYLRDERLGILCGDAEPTEEQLQIVYDQLFPTKP